MPVKHLWRTAALLIAALFVASISAGRDRACAATCGDIDDVKCKVNLSTGITMAYLETGPDSGAAIILVHGLTDSSRSWSTTMRALNGRDPSLHVLAIDQRGHGGTSMPLEAKCAAAPEQCFRMADFADDLIAFMDTKGIRTATLVGYSLGTFVVQEVGLRRPAMVDRAILVATSTTGVDNVALRDYVLKEPVEGSWKKALEAKGAVYPAGFYALTPLDADPNAMDWMAKNWVVDPVADPAFLVPYTPETAAVKLGTWIGASKALLAQDNAARLKAWSLPTLVIWGVQDNIFLGSPDQDSVKAVFGAAARSSGKLFFWKQYGVLPLPASGAQESDIGHNVQWGAPNEVAADIDAFVKTGKPLSSLPHSDAAPNLTHIVVDATTSVIVSVP